MTSQAILKANIAYLLDSLAGFEPADIEDDSFEVAVNDDQFAQCSIVALAEAASARIKELELENTESRKIINWLHSLNFKASKETAREIAVPKTFQQMYQGEFKPDERMEALRNRYIQYYKDTACCSNQLLTYYRKQLKHWICCNGFTPKECSQVKKSIGHLTDYRKL